MLRNRRLEGSKEGPVLFGTRHLQCFLLFLCLAVSYALRVNLSVAIVAITTHNNNNTNTTNPDFEEYDWSDGTKSVVLSSFFWGYVVTQIPGGLLAKRYGAKLMLFCGILICSLLNILIPLCASLGGWKLVCGLRILQGLCQGMLFPCVHTLLSKWAPVEERGRLGTYCYSGNQFGTVVMLASSGAIASSVLGWPSIFYLSGAAGIFWCALWFLFGSSSPSENKSISPEERKFIETSLGNTKIDDKQPIDTPWVKIFTSMPFISLFIVHSAQTWGFWTLLTEIPSYMHGVLEKDIKSNALLSALPYLVMFILSYVFSFIADVLARRQCISLSVSRKLFNSIGLWIPMIALIFLGYVRKDQANLAIALLTIAVGTNAGIYLGLQVNHIDLAPNHAGTLMGITNCAANIMSIIAPLTVGIIVTDSHDPTQWRIIFFIASGIYLIGNLLFIIFGRTENQSWNDPVQSNTSAVNHSDNVEAVKSH